MAVPAKPDTSVQCRQSRHKLKLSSQLLITLVAGCVPALWALHIIVTIVACMLFAAFCMPAVPASPGHGLFIQDAWWFLQQHGNAAKNQTHAMQAEHALTQVVFSVVNQMSCRL